MSGVLNWVVCKRCFKPYDIGTNFEICPACRLEEKKKLLDKIDELRIIAEAKVLQTKERENGRTDN